MSRLVPRSGGRRYRAACRDAYRRACDAVDGYAGGDPHELRRLVLDQHNAMYRLTPHEQGRADDQRAGRSRRRGLRGRCRRMLAAVGLTAAVLAAGVLVAPQASARGPETPPSPDDPIAGFVVRSDGPPSCTEAERTELALRPQDTCDVVPDDGGWVEFGADGSWPWCALDPNAPSWVRDVRDGPC